MLNHSNIRGRGFTLIEILVSVALFSVVMVVALGALLALSSATRRAEAINTAVNNLASALDTMTRNIRTGTEYYCGSGGAGNNTNNCTLAPQFTFLSADGANAVTYCLSDNGSTCDYSGSTAAALTCATGKSCSILRCITAKGSVCAGPYLPLTTPEINVSFLGFTVTGAARGDQTQPRVTILMSGSIPVTATQTSTFNLQTTVTQRIYDQ